MAVPVAPHELMGRMLQNEEFRQQILFAWHLPQQHGGGFGRYPAQLAWLYSWLKTGRQGRESTISCLDAASGSGEGTYELAAAVFAAGYQPCAITVRGATLQPLEVAAAALALFPHDRPRQAAYRLRVGTICPPELLERISFQQEDLKRESHETNCYTVILCNGLLGGPLLHERCTVLRVLKGLVQRLKPGGILLADDRFHAGWRRVITPTELRELFIAAGLHLVAVPSGIGGICLSAG
jgi:SAM-dependent methyltransferase